MKKEILRLEHLNYSIQGTKLMHDLSLNVFEHEIFGLLGLVDAGKTLLADYLTGEKSIDGGRVYFNDVEIKNCRDLSRTRLDIAHITNEKILIQELTIAQNFYISVKNSSRIIYTKKQAVRFARSCLNDLEVNISADTPVRELNRCHQHIIAMCIAFYCHSRLIIVDDAMAGYSPQDIQDFRKFLNNLRRRNIAIMIMSNSIEYATILSDRIAVLKDGHCAKVIERSRFDKNTISQILLGTRYDEYEEPPTKKTGERKKIWLAVPGSSGKELVFEAEKGSVVSVFDPEDALYGAFVSLRDDKSPMPISYSSGSKTKRLYSVSRALRERTAIIFEDYFNMLFRDSSVRNNIELFSMDRLAKGPLGYISKRREQIFLKDSEYYSGYGERKRADGHMMSMAECQEILLERLRMFNPELLISVNLFFHLDPALINNSLSCFCEMAKSGTTVFVFDNGYSAFLRQFDTAFVVRGGVIESRLSRDDVKNTDVITKYLTQGYSGIV